jgi:ribonucleoside-triphosphate reductase
MKSLKEVKKRRKKNSKNGFTGKATNGHLRLTNGNGHSNGNGKQHILWPKSIVKRDGREESFDPIKISTAIGKCFKGLGKEPAISLAELTQKVVNSVSAKYPEPSVENVQDIVEIILQSSGEFEAAKAYILYRAEHAKLREERPIPLDVKEAFEESDRYFPSQLQKFQFFDKYSRFNYKLGRRETWIETVDRAMSFLKEISKNKLSIREYERLGKAILAMKVTPSMRLLASAGESARRQNACIYNCSYLPIDSVDAFCEALLISMSGCGVGFSVESQYIEKLPRVKRQIGTAGKTFIIPDSTEGWVDALKLGMNTWLAGKDIKFDYSLIRPAGSILKIKGGRASGPEPLRTMLDFVRTRILARQGSFLRSIDAHDMVCMVGYAAVSGGVRRTAMISLFDWDDTEMRLAKSGDFERDNWQRWNANNSVVIPERGLTQEEYIELMLNMHQSQRGEPGIFNRLGAKKFRPERRKDAEFGSNPCGEINLRPYEFCNLSIVIARAEDNYEDLKEKVEVATIIGTIQSMATHFPGLRPSWRKNCEEERLLGVDINGQMDCLVVQDPSVMTKLKQVAIETNRKYAVKLGINPAAAVTCVKPSGNSSQLFNCSSGIHSRWSQFYIRNIRVGTHTPIFKVLKDAGVPMDPENGQTAKEANTWVAHFPVKSPEGAITRKSRTALEQCEYWLRSKIFWTEHNPSVTITYQINELVDLIKWVWEHRDYVGGMSFLPATDARYSQMPFEEITKEEYEKLAEEFPKIDFSKLWRYEEEDYTKAAQELACMGAACEIELVPQGEENKTMGKVLL